MELFSDSPTFNGTDAHELNPIIDRKERVNNLMMVFIVKNVNVVVNTNIGVIVHVIESEYLIKYKFIIVINTTLKRKEDDETIRSIIRA